MVEKCMKIPFAGTFRGGSHTVRSGARLRLCRETSRVPASARQSQNVPVSYPRSVRSLSTQTTLYAHLQGFSANPLTDSNRRPPLYEEGPWVKWQLSCRPVMAGAGVVGGEQCSSLYRLLGEDKAGLELAPVAHLLKDRQSARGSVAPAGAKGWSRVSMCQIASASRRARSTWATLAPRCLPTRALVRW
jgi:hypothetical protein